METKKRNNSEHRESEPHLANDIWFKAGPSTSLPDLKKMITNHEVTTTIRLGDRTEQTTNEKGGYKEGLFITLKIQNSEGKFEPEEIDIIITDSELKKLGELLPTDLKGATLDGSSKEEVSKKLSQVYGKEISSTDEITVVKFEYADNISSAKRLVELGILTPAAQPRNNPDNLEFDNLVLPLIEHDYPAKTAAMWNAAYQKFGMEVGNIMMVGNPENSKQILKILERDHQYLGGGAGVGFKDEASKHIELDPLAEAVGSINFIRKTPEGKLRGYNTDGIGYAVSLEEKFIARKESIAGKKAVVLGAGGTSNSIAFALAERGMRVVILNRTVKKAEDLAKKINEYFGKPLAEAGGEDRTESELRDADAVINVSTKGSAGEMENYSALASTALPATPENIQKNLEAAAKNIRLIPKTAILSDIVLTKNGTPFLNAAKENGFETLDGIPMVINQGVEAFWILHQKELEEKGITKDQVAAVMKKAANG